MTTVRERFTPAGIKVEECGEEEENDQLKLKENEGRVYTLVRDPSELRW